MNDPMSPQQPFQPEATPVRAGCSKAALFGCGGLFVLLLIGGIIAVIKANEITEWGFRLMEQQVMARLPAETSDEDAGRVREGFAELTKAVQEDRVDPLALEQLQPVILRFADPNKTPAPEDVDRLIELLEMGAGTRGDPAPAPGEPELAEPPAQLQTSG